MIAFTATEIGYLEDDGVILCGASSADSGEAYHYISFQRPAVTGGDDDEGVYFEVDDEANCGFGIVASCELEPGTLTVRLAGDFSALPGEVVVVRFSAYESSGLGSIEEGLRKIFTGQEHRLKVNA